MIYKDTLREPEFLKLAAERDICVSLYFPTTRVSQDANAERIQLKNAARIGFAEAESIADKNQMRAMEALVDELHDDEEFWAHQAYGLGVLITPKSIRTYRLGYSVETAAEVSDRFYLKPLVPTLRPKSAWVLAISHKFVKLFEFTTARELVPVNVPNLPADFSDATGRAVQMDRAAARRLEGEEGHRALQTQFVRAIENAVRPVVSGSHVPLILAASADLQAIYRRLNHYDQLSEESISGNFENANLEDLRKAVVPIAMKLRQDRVDNWVEQFEQRKNDNRAISDLATIARLASQGQVSHLLVDADAMQYGTVDDEGNLKLSDLRDAATYDVIDEVMTRAMQAGAEVLAVRKGEDAPEALMPIAAILRWA